ncbi:23410_t:CDS:2, partial [Entrophospora sp. SA101]
ILLAILAPLNVQTGIQSLSLIVSDTDRIPVSDTSNPLIKVIALVLGSTSILAELIDYRMGNDPYDSFLQFNANVLNFLESTIGHNKVLAMSQIHSNILYQHQINKDNQTDRQIKPFHIPKPTILDHFDENDNDDVQIIDEEDLFVNENHETNDDDFLENDNESVNSNSDKNVNQWNIIVAHWRDEANQENQLENHSDESLLEEDLIMIFWWK